MASLYDNPHKTMQITRSFFSSLLNGSGLFPGSRRVTVRINRSDLVSGGRDLDFMQCKFALLWGPRPLRRYAAATLWSNCSIWVVKAINKPQRRRRRPRPTKPHFFKAPYTTDTQIGCWTCIDSSRSRPWSLSGIATFPQQIYGSTPHCLRKLPAPWVINFFFEKICSGVAWYRQNSLRPGSDACN